MKLSIIVPVYQVEAHIDECITSILDQTFRDFELILVDDGSLDRCPAICDVYAQKDSRIRVIHQKNQGLSAARNTGLQAARGGLYRICR
ncbi:glycosyltransferase family 2 protein [Faecalicoccus pleomorphus]|uniref:glycosyltransferase family 2 protein n=1 Tax=Faecalicoccus pleomorphus TaxID=1323 RepID=UPI00226C4388|nr:glycosyltransferase [Faecalicoccus pleomorphus]MDB7985193.1 glycosyltransferase [Faecalicoccus pleomorphus]